MTKSISCMLAWLLVLTVTIFTPSFVFAQGGTGESSSDYVIKSGDTLYELSGKNFNDPNLWARIIEKNQFLAKPSRQLKKDGKLIVVIRPGERLIGLQDLGVVPNPIDISGFRLESTPAPASSVSKNSLVVSPKLASPESISLWYYSWLLWWIVGIALVFFIARWILNVKLSNPLGSGPRTSLGIYSNQAVDLAKKLLVREHYERTDELLQPDQFSIRVVKAVYVKGYANILYPGTKGWALKKFTGEEAFEVIFELPGDELKHIYLLKSTGNQIRSNPWFGNPFAATTTEFLRTSQSQQDNQTQSTTQEGVVPETILVKTKGLRLVPKGEVGVFATVENLVVRAGDAEFRFKNLESGKSMVLPIADGAVRIVHGENIVEIDPEGKISLGASAKDDAASQVVSIQHKNKPA